VVATALLLGLLSLWLGLSPVEGILLGGALARSSTAVVLEQLGEQMELPAPQRAGRHRHSVLFDEVAAEKPTREGVTSTREELRSAPMHTVECGPIAPPSGQAHPWPSKPRCHC
jgi:hypothetical protein